MKGNELTNSVHAIVITKAERQFIHRTIVEERLLILTTDILTWIQFSKIGRNKQSFACC